MTDDLPKVCQRFRETTILQLQAIQSMAGSMADMLAASPEDDEAFEKTADRLVAAVPIAGRFLEMFRATRDCVGGPH